MADRPNILLVVTDQQRRDTIGAYGSSVVQTPATDALAGQGMAFDCAFTPCGLCSPVRSSLLSGVYPHTHQVLTNVALHPVRNQLSPDQDVLYSGLKSAGYRIGSIGKWHVNHHIDPTGFGADRYVSLADYASYRRELGIPFPPESNNYVTPVSPVDPVPVEHCRPAFLADRTIDTIDTFSAGSDRPFFVRLDFHGPHAPTVTPEPYASMYDPASIEPWSNFDDPLDGKPAVQRIKLRHWHTDTMSWSDWQPMVAGYYGEISLIDHQIGRVLAHLERAGLADNTMVIFTADHGDTMGAHHIWNKDYTMYDGIYRVPFIVRWPGRVAPGSRSSEYIHHFLDLTPSLLEVAGAPVPDRLHGLSLLPLLSGERQERLREAFCEFHGCHMGLYTCRMLQTDRYKYVFNTNDIDELYDHETDPGELANLAEDPAHSETLADLRRRLVDWMRRTGDDLYNEWVVHYLTGDLAEAARAPGRMNTPW